MFFDLVARKSRKLWINLFYCREMQFNRFQAQNLTNRLFLEIKDIVLQPDGLLLFPYS